MGSNPTLSAIMSAARASARARIATRPSLMAGLLTHWQSTLVSEVSQNMTTPKFSRRTIIVAICATAILGACALNTAAQKRRQVKHLTVCGNPNASCPSAVGFEAYDLPFRMPANIAIYDTELFYAIILKSVPSRTDDCDKFIPETDRLEAQALFPDHKVFTSRCAEPGHLSYSNTNPHAQLMAVYAGRTLAEANRTLARVKAIGKFSGANVRRMRAMMNGT